MNKEFSMEISFSGRITLFGEAKSKEEMIEKIYESLQLNFECEGVEIEQVEWDLIKEAPQGNRATPFISDMHIEEE
ncbi:hypothetical protein [Clostridium perfringens]|uniref:hypothetical protein n=1 Tax=Clostridium perfringens TaxID=1502 RepID=UPI00374A9224